MIHIQNIASRRETKKECVCFIKLGNKDEIQSLFFFVIFLSLCLPGGLKVTCEYMAQQEGVLCEEVLLLSETNEDVCVKVKVHARVMGEVALTI